MIKLSTKEKDTLLFLNERRCGVHHENTKVNIKVLRSLKRKGLADYDVCYNGNFWEITKEGKKLIKNISTHSWSAVLSNHYFGISNVTGGLHLKSFVEFLDKNFEAPVVKEKVKLRTQEDKIKKTYFYPI